MGIIPIWLNFTFTSLQRSYVVRGAERPFFCLMVYFKYMSYLYRNGTGRNDIAYINDISQDIEYLERYLNSSRTGIRFFTGEESSAQLLERTSQTVLDDIQWSYVTFVSEMYKNMHDFLTDCCTTYGSGIEYRVKESSTSAYISSSFYVNDSNKYFSNSGSLRLKNWAGGGASSFGFAIFASNVNNANGAVSHFNDKYIGMELFTKYTSGGGDVIYDGVGTFIGAERNSLSSTSTGVLLKFSPETCNWVNDTGITGFRFYYE